MSHYTFKPIGYVESPFKQKFGIPRQSGLVEVNSIIRILPEYSVADAFRELDGFSHIWVIFYFHGLNKKQQDEWQATVRPPRLGGNRKVGVFASRSMFRPNQVGLSVVRLEKTEKQGESVLLHIKGGDFLDHTPVLDIKPYLPYADAISTATPGYASQAPAEVHAVQFDEKLSSKIESIEKDHPGITNTIIAILKFDPRPAYRNDEQVYSMRFSEFDISWKVINDDCLVTEIVDLKSE